MARLYFPQPTTVHLGRSDDNPGGAAITYAAGYNEIPDDVVKGHPILSRMVPQSEGAGRRADALRQADEEYARSVGEADRKLAETRARLLQEDLDERARLSEDYADRSEDAARSGRAFLEPHPVREQAIINARTGGAAMQPVPSTVFQSEIMDQPVELRRASMQMRSPQGAADNPNGEGPLRSDAGVVSMNTSDMAGANDEGGTGTGDVNSGTTPPLNPAIPRSVARRMRGSAGAASSDPGGEPGEGVTEGETTDGEQKAEDENKA